MALKTLMAASTRPLILAILSGNEDYGYSIIQKVKKYSKETSSGPTACFIRAFRG